MQALTAKQSLLKRQEALTSRLQSVEMDLQKAYDKDSAERATERENDEVLEVIANETAKELLQIGRALSKIGSGDANSCSSCGQPIGDARLQALPSATTCINCAKSH